MKIEKVNDRQIRCTLTGDDLATRQLKISELAYGSEKAKSLFRDMMRQAEYECGFEAEDIPLVIEAIPVNADTIILIITKVEDPEELDTRFSKFAPSVSDMQGGEEGALPFSQSGFAEEMINMLRQVRDIAAENGLTVGEKETGAGEQKEGAAFTACILQSDGLGRLCSFAKSVAPFCDIDNTLYRSKDGDYHLLLRSGNDANLFARICNIASEFGQLSVVQDSRLAYISEHYDTIIAKNAVDALSKI